MAPCPPRGRVRALTSTTPRSVRRPGLPSLKITRLIFPDPLLPSLPLGTAAVGVPAGSELVGGAGEPQPMRAVVASDRIARETVSDLLLDLIATLLRMFDDRTDRQRG